MDISLSADIVPIASAIVAGISAWAGVQSVSVSQRREAEERHDLILKEIEQSRVASEEGRAKIYDRIESVQRQLTDALVSKDVHEIEMRNVHQSLQDQGALLNSLTERMNTSCHQQMVRKRLRGSRITD